MDVLRDTIAYLYSDPEDYGIPRAPIDEDGSIAVSWDPNGLMKVRR